MPSASSAGATHRRLEAYGRRRSSRCACRGIRLALLCPMFTRLPLLSVFALVACNADISKPVCFHTPLVLDLDRDGIMTSDPEHGVLFDLRQTGVPVRTARSEER